MVSLILEIMVFVGALLVALSPMTTLPCKQYPASDLGGLAIQFDVMARVPLRDRPDSGRTV
jgi:hypothetical protein